MVIKYLIEKEFKQMMRNIVLPIVFIVLPVGMMNIVPRIATQEVKDLNIAVVDNDHSPLSERLVQKLSASTYLNIESAPASYSKATESIDKGTADLIIEIQPDFEKELINTHQAKVMVSANATNGIKGGLGSSYVSQIVQDYSQQVAEEMGVVASASGGFSMNPRYLYNPELDYKVYMIPALVAMILILLVGFLPALNIVGEKEKGTIEQINVTPVTKGDFIMSKLIPYWIVGLVIFSYAMLMGYVFHGVAPAGSLWLIYLCAIIFILVVSSFSLIVSNYSDTTQQAALVMFFFLVIFILMSGLLTPVVNMPEWAQKITLVNPLRYYIDAMRTLYLKGSSLQELSSNYIAMSIYAVVVGIWAIVSYRKTN